MQLLITGGLGFIGSNLVRHLLKTHPTYSIINIDALTYAGHHENLTDIENDKRYKFVHGKIQDAKLVNAIVSGQLYGRIDGIINLAAESHVDRSIENPSIFVETNILGTQVLLEAAFRHGSSVDSNGERQFSIKYVPGFNRRSVRFARTDRLLHGNHPASPQQPILCQQSSG